MQNQRKLFSCLNGFLSKWLNVTNHILQQLLRDKNCPYFHLVYYKTLSATRNVCGYGAKMLFVDYEVTVWFYSFGGYSLAFRTERLLCLSKSEVAEHAPK